MALGLILSSSDFKVLDASEIGFPTPGNDTAGDFTGGELGTALLNSGLSSPLTSGGDFGRSYAVPASNGAYAAYYISDTVDGSLYSGSVSTSKAYSMRAWVRMHTNAGFKSNGSGIGLSFLGQNNKLSCVNDTISRTYHLGGYTLQFSGHDQSGNDDSTTHPSLNIGTNEVSGTINGSFPPTLCSGGTGGSSTTYSRDAWHRIRFDMVPIGAAGVTLNAYTSSAGDVPSGQEVWELVGTKFVDATDAVYIDPTLPTNGMGFYAWRDKSISDAEDTVYIDQFEILVQDL